MHNIKYILFALFAASFANVSAQSEKCKSEFRINLGYEFGLKKGNGGMFAVHPEVGWNLSEQFYLGIVTGVETDEKFKYLSIPIYIHPEVSFDVPGKITPFFGIEGGCVINTQSVSDHANNEVTGSINPMIGIRTPIGKHTDFSLSFGYKRTIVLGGGGDYLGFKAGVNFGCHGTGFKRFMNNSLQSIEVETMSYSGKSEYSGSKYIETERVKAVFGLHYSILFPIIDNLYLGPSIAVGICKEEYDWHRIEQDPEPSHQTDPYGYVLARARYQVKQLTFAKKFYPFAQVEAGLGIFSGTSFACNAAVGISYEVGSDNSIDLSVGYNTVAVEKAGDDDGGVENKGALRLALGYTF